MRRGELPGLQGGSLMEIGEVQNIMERAGLAPGVVDWASFDHDGDGKLSPIELGAAAQVANEAGVPEKLISLRDAELVKQREDSDREIFLQADIDGSSLLEQGEIHALLNDTPLAGQFDWRSFDNDQDGSLSEREFVAAGPAAAHALQSGSSSLLEEGESTAAGTTWEAEDQEVFRHFDKDGSNRLEPGEMHDLLTQAGLKEGDFEWWPYDVDMDGALSQKEFLSAGPAALKALSPAMKAFKHADTDGSSLLEAGEIDALQKQVGIHRGDIDWASFDQDGDDRISEDEFMAAAPTIDAAIPSGAASTLQQEDVSADDRPSPNIPRVDKQHFHKYDANKSGKLEKREVKKLLARHKAKDFDWRQVDKDGDGALSMKEFENLIQQVLKAQDARKAKGDSGAEGSDSEVEDSGSEAEDSGSEVEDSDSEAEDSE